MPTSQILLGLGQGSGPPPPPPQDVIDAGYYSDNNWWVVLGGIQGTGVQSGATNAAYTYPDGSSGYTLNFASGDWMQSNNLNVGNNTWSNNAISINMWFYPTAYGVQLLGEISENSNWNAGYHLSLLEIDSNGFVKARFYQGPLPGIVMTSSTKVILNQWNHIYLAEATNGVHTFTVNGIAPRDSLPEYTRLKPSGTKYYVVGANDISHMGNTGRFEGKLGILEIHDYVVASTFYSSQFNKFRPTPLVHNLDAGDVSSYNGPGSTTWTDTVLGTAFDFFATTTMPTYSSDAGGCIVFDAAGGAYARSITSPLTANRWTIEVWHYYDGTNTSGYPCIFSERYTASNINYALGTLTGTTADLQAGYYVPAGGWLTTPFGYSLSAGNWYHIVGTYDGSNVKLYINSILQQTSPAGYSPLSSQSGINLMRRWDNPEFWGGKLAQVRLYTGALSQTNINANFNSEKFRYGIS